MTWYELPSTVPLSISVCTNPTLVAHSSPCNRPPQLWDIVRSYCKQYPSPSNGNRSAVCAKILGQPIRRQANFRNPKSASSVESSGRREKLFPRYPHVPSAWKGGPQRMASNGETKEQIKGRAKEGREGKESRQGKEPAADH
jgi:hypothetical protein